MKASLPCIPDTFPQNHFFRSIMLRPVNLPPLTPCRGMKRSSIYPFLPVLVIFVIDQVCEGYKWKSREDSYYNSARVFSVRVTQPSAPRPLKRSMALVSWSLACDMSPFFLVSICLCPARQVLYSLADWREAIPLIMFCTPNW